MKKRLIHMEYRTALQMVSAALTFAVVLSNIAVVVLSNIAVREIGRVLQERATISIDVK